MTMQDAAHCSHHQSVSPEVWPVKGPKPTRAVGLPASAVGMTPQGPILLLEDQLKGPLQHFLP